MAKPWHRANLAPGWMPPAPRGLRPLVLGGALALALLTPPPLTALEAELTAPGAPDDLAQELRAASQTLTAQSRGLESAQDFLAAALSDYRTLVQLLYDRGYFSPTVKIRLDGREAAGIDPLNPPAKVTRAEIEVDPGRPFRFGVAELGPQAPGTELPAEFRAGGPASTAVLRDAAAAGIAGWRQAGHAKARIAGQRVTARHGVAELDARIHLDPGRQLRFGQLKFDGDSAVTPEAMRAIAGFPVGEVYDPEDLQKVGTRLRRTGTFASVALKEAEQANADGTLDVTARVEDSLPRRLSFGVELSSNEGLDLSAAWMHRNLTGAADRLRFEARVRNIGGSDPIEGRISLRLDQPAKLGPDDSMFYLAELERLNRTHYAANRAAALIGVRRTFSDQLYAEISAGALLTKADDAFGANRRFDYLALPTRLEWDQRDLAINPSRGFYLDARVTPLLGLSGTKSATQATLDARAYLPILSDGRLVLAGRAQLGSVLGAGHRDISPELLFYSGGAGSVRGHPFQSLGVPVGAATAGGRSMMLLSGEVRGRVTDKISLVGFFDYGAIDSEQFITTAAQRHSGAGLGVRYDVGGFGPIRVDLGFPVSGNTSDGFQFYIGIGQAF